MELTGTRVSRLESQEPPLEHVSGAPRPPPHVEGRLVGCVLRVHAATSARPSPWEQPAFLDGTSRAALPHGLSSAGIHGHGPASSELPRVVAHCPHVAQEPQPWP